jgi:lambda family phage tail tape measure protein
LTNQARKDGTQYSVEYINGISAINQAEADQIAQEKIYFQERDAMNSDWKNGVLSALGNISELSLNTAATAQQTFMNMFSSMTDSTGKMSFGSLIESMIQGIIKLQLQMLAAQAAGALLGFMGLGSTANAFTAGGTQFTMPTGTSYGVAVPGGLSGLGYGTPFASGGYTGNMGVHEPAGVVHGKEFVVNARATAMPGVRPMLESLNRGKPGYAGGGFVGTGGAVGAMGPNIVINNYAGSQVEATAQVSQDATGNQQVDIVIRQVENQIAGNISKGRGPVHDAIRTKFGVTSRPGK